MDDLIGVFEIAEMAGVSPSAVSNWRMRFPDFPAPLVDLKSGPIFRKAIVHAWLANRNEDVSTSMSLYEQLAGKRGDDIDLRESIALTVKKMVELGTSATRPGMLLGRIQSGKTRAFLGVIAKSLDIGYEIAVIITKETTSLAKQTLSRVCSDFDEFIEAEIVQAYDIMKLPALTQYDLTRKLIIVAKKEDDNLARLLKMFQRDYPELCSKKLLLIDDEADFSSVSFSSSQGQRRVGVISNQIDQLRLLVSEISFLQVTATPYSLYLQPEEAGKDDRNTLFLPKSPAFTVILPSHDRYIGGDQYFREVDDVDSPAQFLYKEVPLKELEALKKPDGRRLSLNDILCEKNVAVLRGAIMSFVVGGCIRRLQQSSLAQKPEKYSFLFHTEQKRDAHAWQLEVADAIRKQLVVEAAQASPEFHGLLSSAYHDLARSVNLGKEKLPSLSEVVLAAASAFTSGQIMVTVVNSDKDVDLLLDSGGQLHLRNPFNIFIGGQILDRGITIKNLIGFYYGRNPKKFQQDTVLQHSRMYGARSRADLTVTRLFAPSHIYQIMRRINEFDSGLRTALLDEDNSQGVHFIQRDESGLLV